MLKMQLHGNLPASSSGSWMWCAGTLGDPSLSERHLWGQLEVEIAQQLRQGRGVVHARQSLTNAVTAAVAEGDVPLDAGCIWHLSASTGTLWLNGQDPQRAWWLLSATTPGCGDWNLTDEWERMSIAGF